MKRASRFHAGEKEKAPQEAGPVINGYAAPREERLDGADFTVTGPSGGVYAAIRGKA
jgi:hypothetical protein